MKQITQLLIISAILGSSLPSYALTEVEDYEEYQHYYNLEAHLKLMRTFKDWGVYKKVEKYSTSCYAITSSYRSKSYQGVRELPFIAIAYKGPQQYSFTVYAGFELDRDKGMILKTNSKSFLLSVTRPAYGFSYTSVQDKTIINNIIQDGKTVSVRSYDLDGNTALDFYSLKGFSAAIRYLENHCH